MVDVGSFNLKLNPLSVNSTIQFGWQFGMLNVSLLNLTVTGADKGVDFVFAGVSDISDYFSEAITFAINTAFNRLKSLTRHKGLLANANLGANAFLGVLPDEAGVPD